MWVGPSEGLEAVRQALTPSDGQGSLLNTTQVFVSLALANEPYSLKTSMSQEFGLLQRRDEEERPV